MESGVASYWIGVHFSLSMNRLMPFETGLNAEIIGESDNVSEYESVYYGYP